MWISSRTRLAIRGLEARSPDSSSSSFCVIQASALGVGLYHGKSTAQAMFMSQGAVEERQEQEHQKRRLPLLPAEPRGPSLLLSRIIYLPLP